VTLLAAVLRSADFADCYAAVDNTAIAQQIGSNNPVSIRYRNPPTAKSAR
jgi:hypothetical protein